MVCKIRHKCLGYGEAFQAFARVRSITDGAMAGPMSPAGPFPIERPPIILIVREKW
jgi:hypothetical protein